MYPVLGDLIYDYIYEVLCIMTSVQCLPDDR